MFFFSSAISEITQGTFTEADKGMVYTFIYIGLYPYFRMLFLIYGYDELLQ